MRRVVNWGKRSTASSQESEEVEQSAERLEVDRRWYGGQEKRTTFISGTGRKSAGSLSFDVGLSI